MISSCCKSWQFINLFSKRILHVIIFSFTGSWRACRHHQFFHTLRAWCAKPLSLRIRNNCSKATRWVKQQMTDEYSKQVYVMFISIYLSFVPFTLRWRHNGLDSVSNYQPHDCLLKPFIQTRFKENIKALRYWPLCGEFTGDRWILRTNGQLRGKFFHLVTSSWTL